MCGILNYYYAYNNLFPSRRYFSLFLPDLTNLVCSIWPSIIALSSCSTDMSLLGTLLQVYLWLTIPIAAPTAALQNCAVDTPKLSHPVNCNFIKKSLYFSINFFSFNDYICMKLTFIDPPVSRSCCSNEWFFRWKLLYYPEAVYQRVFWREGIGE